MVNYISERCSVCVKFGRTLPTEKTIVMVQTHKARSRYLLWSRQANNQDIGTGSHSEQCVCVCVCATPDKLLLLGFHQAWLWCIAWTQPSIQIKVLLFSRLGDTAALVVLCEYIEDLYHIKKRNPIQSEIALLFVFALWAWIYCIIVISYLDKVSSPSTFKQFPVG